DPEAGLTAEAQRHRRRTETPADGSTGRPAQQADWRWEADRVREQLTAIRALLARAIRSPPRVASRRPSNRGLHRTPHAPRWQRAGKSSPCVSVTRRLCGWL